MPAMGTSGLMSGEGKRATASRSRTTLLSDSTLPWTLSDGVTPQSRLAQSCKLYYNVK